MLSWIARLRAITSDSITRGSVIMVVGNSTPATPEAAESLSDLDSNPLGSLKSVQELLARELNGSPLVSVVIPTYNRLKVLLRAIDTALNQTYRNLEVIVVDDGSTDDTQTAVKAYGDRIRYIHQKNQGASAARNLGITAANGKYIAFLDSDDEWLPHKLEKQIALLENHPEYSFVACLATEENRTYTGYENHATQFMKFILQPFTQNMTRYVVRRQCLQEHGLFDTTIHGPEDWELWLRLLKNGCRFGYVPEALMSYTASDDAISSRPYAMLAGEAIIRDRYVGTLPTLWQRIRLGSWFTARSYMNASICFREQGELWKSLGYMLASIAISPFGPRNKLRLPAILVLGKLILARMLRKPSR